MRNQNRKEVIEIKGLHCTSCAEKIESKIGSLPGVEKIKVSLIENKAFVNFDPKKINLEKIKSEIISLGYCVCGKKPCICKKKEKKGFWQGIAYGLIPHIGCIAFIIGSILGVTALMQFFKPLLLNRYFFHILILVSLLFATLSSLLYLKKNGFLSLAGIKKKWKYLATMYCSTIGINLLLFMVIFPLLANVSIAPSVTAAAAGLNGNNNDFSSLKLSVDIPCPGHATLISNELKSINGVIDIKFSFPNVFEVKYDPTKTSKQEILSLDVFNTYKATVLDESSIQQNGQQTIKEQLIAGGGCCGGGGSCGGSGGGCGCGFRR
ncbi:MAG: cation transporter [Candidatus Pacearchaeota archaeon]